MQIGSGPLFLGFSRTFRGSDRLRVINANRYNRCIRHHTPNTPALQHPRGVAPMPQRPKRRRPRKPGDSSPPAGRQAEVKVGNSQTSVKAASGQPAPNSDGSLLQDGVQRNGALDSLRGLAIVLMVLDHIAGIWFGLGIQDSVIRFGTRLAMPLFCVLMGYFLMPDRRWEAKKAWRRPVQIFLAAVLVNLVFWPYYGSIEILGTLLLAYLVFLASGRWFWLSVLVIAAYPVDPLRIWFDFPPTLVIAFVAQGMVLRRFGIVAAMASGAWLGAGTLWIDSLEPGGVNQRLCLFILPATLLVYLGESVPNKSVPGLEWLGRHPLSVYVTQYYIVFTVAYLMAYLMPR